MRVVVVVVVRVVVQAAFMVLSITVRET